MSWGLEIEAYALSSEGLITLNVRADLAWLVAGCVGVA